MTNEKIREALADGGAFIAFLTGGDPDADTTVACIHALEEGGADLIEIGIPFSDPCAEGPVIEAADMRALKGGMNTRGIFEILRRVRAEGVKVPIVLMTYYNPVFKYGLDEFMQELVDSDGQGVIIPDLPFEESAPAREAARKAGVDLISLVAPTSDARIEKIAKGADGFLYVVSSMGVTGMRENITTDIGGMIDKIHAASDIPTAVGFGIATPEQAEIMCRYADGAIVGSAIVRIIEEHGQNAADYVRDYTKQMKAGAVRGAAFRQNS